MRGGLESHPALFSGTSVSGAADDEELGKRGTGESLAHQAGQEQHRTAWPVVHHDVLSLPGRVAGNGDDNRGGLALDRSGVLLDEAVVAVVADEAELLVLIDLAGGEHDGTDGLRALCDALHERALPVTSSAKLFSHPG